MIKKSVLLAILLFLIRPGFAQEIDITVSVSRCSIIERNAMFDNEHIRVITTPGDSLMAILNNINAREENLETELSDYVYFQLIQHPSFPDCRESNAIMAHVLRLASDRLALAAMIQQRSPESDIDALLEAHLDALAEYTTVATEIVALKEQSSDSANFSIAERLPSCSNTEMHEWIALITEHGFRTVISDTTDLLFDVVWGDSVSAEFQQSLNVYVNWRSNVTSQTPRCLELVTVERQTQ